MVCLMAELNLPASSSFVEVFLSRTIDEDVVVGIEVVSADDGTASAEID